MLAEKWAVHGAGKAALKGLSLIRLPLRVTES